MADPNAKQKAQLNRIYRKATSKLPKKKPSKFDQLHETLLKKARGRQAELRKKIR